MLWELAQWSNLLYAKIYIWGHCHTPGVVVRKHSEDIILEISCNSAILLNYLYDNLLPVCVEFYLILDWKKLSVFEMLHTFVNKYTKYTWIVTLIKHYLHDKTGIYFSEYSIPCPLHSFASVCPCGVCDRTVLILQHYINVAAGLQLHLSHLVCHVCWLWWVKMTVIKRQLLAF